MSVLREWGDKLDAWRYNRTDFGSFMQREMDIFMIFTLCATIGTSLLVFTMEPNVSFLFLAIYSEAFVFFFYEPVRVRMEAIAAFDSLPECRAKTVKEELDA